ncbi:hypothetical protein AB0425_13865 [Actinosynnema sp. NPDC051121]
MLWISEFTVVATDHTGQASWEPHMLAPTALTGRQLSTRRTEKTEPTVVATASPNVWWCDARGAVLADGIWAGTSAYHVVLNLTGAHSPKLTVDRKNIVELEDAETDRLIIDQVGSLVANSVDFRNHHWLAAVAHQRPIVADAIFDQAVHSSATWHVDDTLINLEYIGCLFTDESLFRGIEPNRRTNMVVPEPPEWIIRWRLARWVNGAVVNGLSCTPDKYPVARPSDEILLLDFRSPDRPTDRTEWLSIERVVPSGHVFRVAQRLHRTPDEVRNRLADFGYVVASFDATTPISAEDLRLMSYNFDGEAPWLHLENKVMLSELLFAADRLGRTVPEVVDSLRRLGYQVADFDQSIEFTAIDSKILARFMPDDGEVTPDYVIYTALAAQLTLTEVVERLQFLGYRVHYFDTSIEFSRDDAVLLNDLHRWQDQDGVITRAGVVVKAVEHELSISATAERLSLFGYAVADVSNLLDATGDDLLLLSAELDGEGPWLELDKIVPPGHEAMVALRLHTDVRNVTNRLADFGFTTATYDRSVQMSMDDVRLLSAGLNGSDPWLEFDKVVLPGHVFFASTMLRWTIPEVVDRLERFGYRVAPTGPSITASVEDLRLMSRDLDGRAPWLRADVPVTAKHLLSAAVRLRKPVRDVAERLLAFDFRLPEGLTVGPG